MFIATFYILCAICALLFWYSGGWTSSSKASDQSSKPNAALRSFQWTYLLVYLTAVAGDWLQGPHVYALYASYGLSKHEIEILFVAGFGSSMLFGTFVGSFADKYGRKRNCILYGLLYIGACITKHFANFWVLMLGRLFGGIATSILFSAFESWLICEHGKRGFTAATLSTIFSLAAFGNSLVAIGSGLVAEYAADRFGYVAPFDIAVVILLIMCLLITLKWPENFGDAKADLNISFKKAWRYLCEDRRILCLGLIQSLFEGALYTFVLEWTPALSAAMAQNSNAPPAIPYGYVFATFMVAIMIGSSLFRILSGMARPESSMRWVLLITILAFLPPVLFPTNVLAVYCGFIAFEIAVGLFWPAMGFMRSIYMPEAARATLMNFFRIPLNLIVVIILLQDWPIKRIFQWCVFLMTAACVCQHVLYRLTSTKAAGARSALKKDSMTAK